MEAAPGRRAMRALVREVWQGELSGLERHVLRGILLDGRSENDLARELGMHHSAVGRCRQRAEEKLRGGLRYVMRYAALLEQMAQDN
jgi:DNA-directed RNA polymerase specialized sigma subunit